MADLEVLEHAGIEHTPNLLDRSTAASLEVDCEKLLATSHEDIYFESEWSPSEEGSPTSVTTRNYPLVYLRASGLVTLQKVLEYHHPYQDSRDANVLVVRQEPGAIQIFHPDIVGDPQLLIYASDGGKFDFFADPLSPNFESQDVNSGDSLKLLRPYIKHRGRNVSNHSRYVLVLSNRSELN